MHRPALVVYAVVLVLHLAAQAADADAVAHVTQALLMPLLAAYLLAARSAAAPPGPLPRLLRLVLWALAFSWLGDTLPSVLDGDGAFLAMVGCFLLAQVSYLRAFRPYAEESVLHRRRGWLTAYGVVLVALLAACLPSAGALAPAVLVYGGCLVSMAVLSTGVDRLAWAGGALFLVSDSLIALDAFDVVTLPLQDVLVMATYGAGQLLLVRGTLQRGGVRVPEPLPA